MTHLQKARIAGRGVDMTEKIAYLVDEDTRNHETVSFLQVRLGDTKTRYKARMYPGRLMATRR